MVTNNYTPYQGGVVSSINATVAALQRCGHRVTIITLDFLGEAHQDPAWVIRLQCPIKFRYKKNHMAIAWRAKKQLRSIIAALKPDIIHVHHPFFLGYMAAEIAKSQSIAVIFTYHTIYEAYAHYIPLPEQLTRPIIRHKVLSFAKQINGIIAPSTAIQHYLQQMDVKTPVRIIPSSLQDIFFSSKRDVASADTAGLHLLTVGRMVKEKNVEFLLRVAAALQEAAIDFRFTLIGYGAEYERLQCYAYQELLLSSDRVVFVHQPSQDMLLEAYQKADIFLFASQTDTQGLVLAEAMVSGVPVIALEGPGQRDIIRQGENGFIIADEQAMVAQIVTLSKNRSLLASLAQGALQTGQLYRPENLAQRVTAFYQEIREKRLRFDAKNIENV